MSMKRIAMIVVGFFVSCLLFSAFAFADEGKTEVQLTELGVNFYESDVGVIGEKYPLSDYLSVNLSDNSEVKILTDGTIKTVVALDEEGDEYEIQWLECALSQPVKRDEVLRLSLTDKVQTNEYDMVTYHLYKVENDTVDEGILFKDQLPAKNSYVMDFNYHIDNNHSEPYQNFKDLSFRYGDKANVNTIFIQFTYGVEEQEVMDLIEALPEAADVTKNDAAAIKAAREAYDGLAKWKTTEPADPDIQNKVTNYDKLVAVEAALAALPDTIDLSKAVVTANAQTYTGKALTPKVTVKLDGKALTSADYDIVKGTYINAGSYTITINGKGNYTGTAKGKFTVNKAPQKVTAKAKTQTFKVKKLKKKAQTFKITKVVTAKGQGKITYTVKAANAKSKKSLKIKSGKVTVKKGTKKGTYKVKVTVKVAGNKNYKAASKTVNLKIIVK